MPEYIYLIVRTNDEGDEKTIAGFKDRERAEACRAGLEELEELHAAGWIYEVEPLKVSG